MVDVCECLAGAVVEAAGEAGKVVNTCRTRFWTRMADADRAAAAVAADREHLPEDANVAVVVDVALTPAAPGQHLQSPGVKHHLPELPGRLVRRSSQVRAVPTLQENPSSRQGPALSRSAPPRGEVAPFRREHPAHDQASP